MPNIYYSLGQCTWMCILVHSGPASFAFRSFATIVAVTVPFAVVIRASLPCCAGFVGERIYSGIYLWLPLFVQ